VLASTLHLSSRCVRARVLTRRVVACFCGRLPLSRRTTSTLQARCCPGTRLWGYLTACRRPVRSCTNVRSVNTHAVLRCLSQLVSHTCVLKTLLVSSKPPCADDGPCATTCCVPAVHGGGATAAVVDVVVGRGSWVVGRGCGRPSVAHVLCRSLRHSPSSARTGWSACPRLASH
jgi:hypothetical protein